MIPSSPAFSTTSQRPHTTGKAPDSMAGKATRSTTTRNPSDVVRGARLKLVDHSFSPAFFGHEILRVDVFFRFILAWYDVFPWAKTRTCFDSWLRQVDSKVAMLKHWPQISQLFQVLIFDSSISIFTLLERLEKDVKCQSQHCHERFLPYPSYP